MKPAEHVAEKRSIVDLAGGTGGRPTRALQGAFIGLVITLSTACATSAPASDEPTEPSEVPVTVEATTAPPTVPVWPDEDSTGVPAGTQLAPRAGNVVVDTPGTVLEGLDIDGCLLIEADDVTVRNTRVRCAQPDGYVVFTGWGARDGVVLEDVEIDGADVTANGIGGSGFVLRRADVHSVQDGIKVKDRARIEDSYVHDLTACDGCHNDGLQSSGGRDVRITGNNIDNELTQTSAVLIAPDLEELADYHVIDNRLAGGGYAIYFFDPSGTVMNNTVESGFYGHLHPESTAADWSGNETEAGQPLDCPACASPSMQPQPTPAASPTTSAR